MLKQLPLRLHHQAFAVKDQERTRQFMEDVLGIPLVATWCEKVFRSEVGREVEYCHTFYELADGGAIAYFQYADEECWEMNRFVPAKRGDAGALHSAFKVTRETQDEIRQRLKRAGVSFREIDHGYCHSLYLTSPDDVEAHRAYIEDNVKSPIEKAKHLSALNKDGSILQLPHQ